MPEPNRQLAEKSAVAVADETGAAEEIAADEAALEAALDGQRGAVVKTDGSAANGGEAARPTAPRTRVAAVEAVKTAPPEPPPKPFKRYDNQPFSPEAETELEKAVAAFRAELVKKAVRAKNDVRGDVVSAHNVKTAAAGPLARSQPVGVKLAGMTGNAVMGAALGALVSLLTTPPPPQDGGLKPATLALLFALVTIGVIGGVWQIMRDD